MRTSCDNQSKTSVGDCGDRKDDYVLVNGDATLDDHGEIEVSESNANVQGGGGDDNVAVVDTVEELKVENGVVVEEESGGGDLVKENGSVIEDKDVLLIENGDRNNNEGEFVVNEGNLEYKLNEDLSTEERDECNGTACSSLDDDDNNNNNNDNHNNNNNNCNDSDNNGCDSLQDQTSVVSIESQVNCGEIENRNDESENLEDEVQKSELVEDNNVSTEVDEVSDTPINGGVKKSDLIEEDDVHHVNGEIKVSDSGECGLVVTESEVGEEGDFRNEDLGSLESEATVCEMQKNIENKDDLDSDVKPELEECPDSPHERSEGMDDAELDDRALESTGQCDESSTELIQEGVGTLDNSIEDVQCEKFDKFDDDHESDMVVQSDRTLECSVQEDSTLDQMVEDTGRVDVSNKTVDSSIVEEEIKDLSALQFSVNGTQTKVKHTSDEFHDLSNKTCDSECILTFGSFVCQTKSNGVQIVTDGVPMSSSLEGSGVSASLSDIDAQIVTDAISASSLEESRSDSVDGETVDPVRSPFCWLIKVPRLDNVEFEQINKLQVELAKKTQDRDAFWKVHQGRMDVFREAKAKLYAARDDKEAKAKLMMAKKREIDNAQSLLKLARDGNTVERIDAQIHNMEHKIQHETLDLSEEKRLIREIKQLKHQRERLAADTQGQQEVHQATDRKIETEEQLKVLRKEMDTLGGNYRKALDSLKAAERKFEEESKLKQKLEAEYNSLATVREEAYDQLRTLKKQAYEKNKPCYNYRDARTAILNLKAGEDESLEQICVNQVENFMELWNKNNEFRKEYIRCNMRSTLRRFNTLDGRELGVDEKRPLLQDSSDNRVTSAKVNSVATTLTSEREFPLIPKKQKEEGSSKKVIDMKNTNALAKNNGETSFNNGFEVISSRIEVEEKEEVKKITKEEEELKRKEEEKRREEEKERLKEQRRLEEKVKAHEALERKKRMAEKAQARAKIRAEKEAEEKKKEREKRAMKKGKKKGLTSESSETEPSYIPESSSETSREPEITEKPSTIPKKSNKQPALYTKQVKMIKSIPAPPPPLRNRGKKRIPQWTWWLVSVILTAILVFPLGNLDNFWVLKHFISGNFI